MKSSKVLVTLVCNSGHSTVNEYIIFEENNPPVFCDVPYLTTGLIFFCCFSNSVNFDSS